MGYGMRSVKRYRHSCCGQSTAQRDHSRGSRMGEEHRQLVLLRSRLQAQGKGRWPSLTQDGAVPCPNTALPWPLGRRRSAAPLSCRARCACPAGRQAHPACADVHLLCWGHLQPVLSVPVLAVPPPQARGGRLKSGGGAFTPQC